MVGESTKLKCLVNDADPPPIISWTKDNKSLQMGKNMRYAHKHKILHFKLLSMNDSGNYTCIVANKLGKDSYTFQLVVKEHIMRKLPKLDAIQRIQAAVSGNFTITCRTSAKRKRGMPRIRWMKYSVTPEAGTSKLSRTFKAPVEPFNLLNAKKSKKNTRMKWRFDYNKNGSILVSLTFLNVTYRDAGYYECRSSNSRSAKIINSVVVDVKKKGMIEDTQNDDTRTQPNGKFMLIFLSCNGKRPHRILLSNETAPVLIVKN